MTAVAAAPDRLADSELVRIRRVFDADLVDELCLRDYRLMLAEIARLRAVEAAAVGLSDALSLAIVTLNSFAVHAARGRLLKVLPPPAADRP